MPSVKWKSIQNSNRVQFIEMRIRFATFASIFDVSINHYYRKTLYLKDNIFPFQSEIHSHQKYFVLFLIF